MPCSAISSIDLPDYTGSYYSGYYDSDVVSLDLKSNIMSLFHFSKFVVLPERN